jgi:DNA-binding transcriptional MerR regulator
MRRSKFYFTITDAAIFLGKSPVTLRQWERKGVVQFPRLGADRRLTIGDMRALSDRALELGRIDERHHRLIATSLNLLQLIEESK